MLKIKKGMSKIQKEYVLRAVWSFSIQIQTSTNNMNDADADAESGFFPGAPSTSKEDK